MHCPGQCALPWPLHPSLTKPPVPQGLHRQEARCTLQPSHHHHGRGARARAPPYSTTLTLHTRQRHQHRHQRRTPIAAAARALQRLAQHGPCPCLAHTSLENLRTPAQTYAHTHTHDCVPLTRTVAPHPAHRAQLGKLDNGPPNQWAHKQPL